MNNTKSGLFKSWKRLQKVLTGQERFSNREGFSDFNFTLCNRNKQLGVSALVRAKNEEQKISHCLKSIYRLFDEVVFLDNGSEDRTLEVVNQFKQQEDQEGKVKVYHYPFRLARFGPEHDSAPEDSVHSAVYYSNWGISHCSRAFVCKWDADMVLNKEARESFKKVLQQLEPHRPECWTLPGQTIYRSMKRDYYLATGEINKEIMLFPCGFNPRFFKEANWECLKCRPRLAVREFQPVAFYELKFCDEDEFSHWSTNEWPSLRKRREWANFHKIKWGDDSADSFEKLAATFLDDQLT